MITQCICQVCNMLIEGDAKDRLKHIRMEHPELARKKSSFSYEHFKIVREPITLKKIRKGALKVKNKRNNLKRESEQIKKCGKTKRKSIYWGSVIKTAFETSRRKH